MSTLLPTCAFALAIIATGLVAGVFLAFSDFGMRSLGQISPPAGIEAMQEINREVYRSAFIVFLVGMSGYSVLLGFYATIWIGGPIAAWTVAGSIVYFVGTFLVTILFNVPLNKKLDVINHTASSSADFWVIYLRDWTFWNRVRTFAPIVSMLMYLVGFHYLARQQ